MAKRTCSVNDCDELSRKRGWCSTHYGRWRTQGDVLAHIPVRHRPQRSPVCTIEDCDEPHLALGLCLMHHGRQRKHGDPKADVPKRGTVRATCSIEDCQEAAKARSWCDIHYARWRRRGHPLTVLSPGRQRAAAECSARACDRQARTLTWCIGHYERWLTTGDIREDVPFRPKHAKWGSQSCAALGCGRAALAHGLCLRHYQRRWHARLRSDPVKLDAYRARWRASQAAQRRRSPEAANARQRAWRRNNPVAARRHAARKRVQRLRAPRIPFTAAQLAARMAYWGNRCWMCGGPFEAIDHVKPLARGGWHALMNLRPACHADNGRKNARWPYPVSPRAHQEGRAHDGRGELPLVGDRR